MNIIDRVRTTPPSDLQVAIFNESPYVLRDYDFNRGDQRKHDFKDAVELARARVAARGCRQQIRRVRLEDGDNLTPPWLIQDI